MSQKKTKQYAAQMLDNLIELDRKTTQAYYEMGQILSAIQHGKLHNLLGYDSLTDLVEEELSYTSSTAWRYINLYRSFQRLHYTKTEALNMMKEFGMTHMFEVMQKMKDKLSARGIRSRVNQLDTHQINFTLNGEELELTHQALKKLGAEVGPSGRYLNSTEAFLEMVKQVLKYHKEWQKAA